MAGRGPAGAPAIPVLMYHSVAARMTGTFREFTVTAARLREQLAALHDDGWETVTLSEAVRRLHRPDPDPVRRPVVLTFDDAYADFLTQAMPVLTSAGATATLFVPTAHVGGQARWLSGEDAGRRLLDWSDLAALGAAGVEIGSHGHRHAPLDLGHPTGIYQDLLRSRLLLQDRLGVAVDTLAYPYGYQSGKTRQAARDAGYRTACAVIGLPATGRDRPLALPRIAVTEELGGDALRALLADRPGRARCRLRRGKQHVWSAARKTRLIDPAVPAPVHVPAAPRSDPDRHA